jgi:hypothetical protein
MEVVVEGASVVVVREEVVVTPSTTRELVVDEITSVEESQSSHCIENDGRPPPGRPGRPDGIGLVFVVAAAGLSVVVEVE